MQVILGPVQHQFIVWTGEQGFSWDRLLGGAASFGWEL